MPTRNSRTLTFSSYPLPWTGKSGYPLGRILSVSGGPAGLTRFHYDDDDLAAEYDVGGNVSARYMHGPGSDEPILWDIGSMMDCSGTRFLHTNHQGSVIAVADCNGNRVAVNSYDEYGHLEDPIDLGVMAACG